MRYAGLAGARSGLARRRFALAALRFSRADGTSVHHLRRHPLRYRVFSRELCRSVEMEPAGFYHALRNFDRRCLRVYRADHAQPASTSQQFQRRREKFRSGRRRDRFACELDLSAFEASGRVLIGRSNPASSD